MMLRRRSILQGILAGLALPRTIFAESQQDRKFLFLLCNGGWDPTFVFAPELADPNIWVDPAGMTREENGIVFRHSPARQSVANFFQRWGHLTSIVNGVEVRSITHEACRRIILTGASQTKGDDWASIIGGNSPDWLFPSLVVSGPAFSSRYSSSVMRLGPDAQLSKLIDGRCLQESDQDVEALSVTANEKIETFLRQRAASFDQTQQHEAMSNAYLSALDRRQQLSDLDLNVDLSTEAQGFVFVRNRAQPIIESFANGLARCAVLEHLGEWDVSWDSHSNIMRQNDHFDTLFTDLSAILEQISNRPGTSASSLLDEVTIVVLSEMGRAPALNALGGKDHWTYTSAMLIGAGINGGTVCGGFGPGLLGQKMNLATGSVSTSGTLITAKNIGATVVTLAGLDATTLVPDAEPIAAVIDE